MPVVLALLLGWVLGAHGEAFLRAIVPPEATAWVLRTRRDRLAAGLQALGLPVRVGEANYLLAEVGHAGRVAQVLRRRGIRVRDGTSSGLPRALRLSAQPEDARAALLRALKEVL